MAFTSTLRRAIRTLNIVLDKIDQLWIPVNRSWRLNERHYGALQGTSHFTIHLLYNFDFSLAGLAAHDFPLPRPWRSAVTLSVGLNKSETAALHGEKQVAIWRRSYDIPPPPLDDDDPRHPKASRMYAELSPDVLPKAECLKDTVERFLPYCTPSVIFGVERGMRGSEERREKSGKSRSDFSLLS